jgi:hypothetical protein
VVLVSPPNVAESSNRTSPKSARRGQRAPSTNMFNYRQVLNYVPLSDDNRTHVLDVAMRDAERV